MIKQIHLLDDSYWPDYNGWLAKGLDVLYSGLVPEQLEVPYELALAKLKEKSTYCYVVAVELTDGRFHACTLDLGADSVHIDGQGILVSALVGNGGRESCAALIKFIKEFTRELPEHKWINVSKRIAPYSYKGKYYKVE